MKFVRYWLPVVAWMGVIFFLSGRSSVQVAQEPLINFLFFKTLHVIEYSILFVLYFRALKNTLRASIGINLLAVAFFLTLIYAVTDEIHQLFVPTREGRLRDVIIDAIGASIAWISLTHLLPRSPKKLRALAKSWGFI
ncbi:MAG: VanZ family protein [Candidatus Gottesmanbacteria bacterium]|nr:VanZ family protein [Candidatus Gottesmanbacteria bacterium]